MSYLYIPFLDPVDDERTYYEACMYAFHPERLRVKVHVESPSTPVIELRKEDCENIERTL